MNGGYSDEGYSGLDVPTSAALRYVRDRQATHARSPVAAPSNAASASMLLVVDASCDLPGSWLQQNNVAVVPFDIELNRRVMRDTLDEATNIAFVKQRLTERPQSPLSMPLSAVAIRDHLQLWMSPQIDHVVQLSFSGIYSKAHVAALHATQSLVLIHNKVRRSIANRSPLKAWVIDTQTGLTGMAVMAVHAARLRDHGIKATDIAIALERFRSQVHTLLVPGDLRYLSQTLRARNLDSVPRWKMLLATLLDIKPILHVGHRNANMIARLRHHEAAANLAMAVAGKHLVLGLSSPTICISYAGDPALLKRYAGYIELVSECRRRRVELLISPMNMTGALMLGPSALSVSFACEHYQS